MNMVQTYFGAERTTGLLFTCIGVLGIVIALWGWRQGAFWRGAAWPLVIIALVQIGVGASVWVSSPRDQARVQQIVAQEPQRVATEEIPRMHSVLKGFTTNRLVGAALIAVGLLLMVLASRGGTWQGVGVGVVVQVALVLVVDAMAERHAHTYLSWLRTL